MIPRQVISPLLSAFLLPGSGQALNLQWKKAILVCILFLAAWGAVIWLSLAILGVVAASGPGTQEASSHATLYLWIASVICAILWIYGIVDAWRQGRNLDLKDKELLNAINRYR